MKMRLRAATLLATLGSAAAAVTYAIGTIVGVSVAELG